MSRWIVCLCLVMGLLAGGPAAAVQPGEMLDDPQLEARARALSAELRCLVCQNQSIDDSDAPLARDLRLLVRERLTEGDSDREVVTFVVARYGDFVLLRPPFKPETFLLWTLPGVIFALAAGTLAFHLRRRRHDRDEPVVAPLEPDEIARLRDILDRKSP